MDNFQLPPDAIDVLQKADAILKMEGKSTGPVPNADPSYLQSMIDRVSASVDRIQANMMMADQHQHHHHH